MGSSTQIRDRDEFLAYAKRYVNTAMGTARQDGRFVRVEYVRGRREIVGYDWTGHPVFSRRGVPIGVFVAIEDASGELHFGWSFRNAEVRTGVILFDDRTWEPYQRAVEPSPFTRVEAKYRAFRRASRSNLAAVTTPPRGDWGGFVARMRADFARFQSKRSTAASA